MDWDLGENKIEKGQGAPFLSSFQSWPLLSQLRRTCIYIWGLCNFQNSHLDDGHWSLASFSILSAYKWLLAPISFFSLWNNVYFLLYKSSLIPSQAPAHSYSASSASIFFFSCLKMCVWFEASVCTKIPQILKQPLLILKPLWEGNPHPEPPLQHTLTDCAYLSTTQTTLSTSLFH